MVTSLGIKSCIYKLYHVSSLLVINVNKYVYYYCYTKTLLSDKSEDSRYGLCYIESSGSNGDEGIMGE